MRQKKKTARTAVETQASQSNILDNVIAPRSRYLSIPLYIINYLRPRWIDGFYKQMHSVVLPPVPVHW